MSFSDEEIIAFLLGDADNELADRIRSSLPGNEDLVDRISHFRTVLNHLDGTSERFEPPADLIESTLARIDEAEQVDSDSGLHSQAETEFDQPIVSRLSVTVETAGSSRSWMDSAVLTLSLTLLCCLTIPAILRARFESRRAQCANNLRHTGQALFEYALRRPDLRFPFVASSGPESFAGVFVLRLNDAELLPSGRLAPCPSLNGIERPTLSSLAVPSLEQFCCANESLQECIKSSAGGDYAYNLGVYENGKLDAPKYQGSSHFAILADAPLFVNESEEFIAHDGRGINILFDDGQIRFFTSEWIQGDETADNPFRNLLGAHEAGMSRDDSSLAPSWFPPFGQTVAH